MAFLMAMYYRYLHPIVEPVVTKLWRERVTGEDATSGATPAKESQAKSSSSSRVFSSDKQPHNKED
jgi:hypothetical protein